MKTRILSIISLIVFAFNVSASRIGQEERELLDSVASDPYAEFAEFAQEDPVTRVALVLSDIYSKKDMEFVRGFLMGVKQADLPPNSISLKVMNGEIPSDSLDYELEAFGPHIIFSTFEKETPVALRSFSRHNGAQWVNVFDAKSDDYLYNSTLYQVLAPSDVFNASVSRFILDNLGGNMLVLVGDPDPSDKSLRDLILEWPEEELMIMSPEDMNVFSLDNDQNYLFYPLSGNNDDIKEFLAQTVRLISETPTAGVRIFGRPNWIAINDLPSLIANLEVFVPAKCYFDPSSEAGKTFISAYNSMYGHAPIRSYPVYAVMGYDVSKYFLPLVTADKDWYSGYLMPEQMTQSYFDFKGILDGGTYNSGGFILHYEPWGTMTKVAVN